MRFFPINAWLLIKNVIKLIFDTYHTLGESKNSHGRCATWKMKKKRNNSENFFLFFFFFFLFFFFCHSYLIFAQPLETLVVSHSVFAQFRGKSSCCFSNLLYMEFQQHQRRKYYLILRFCFDSSSRVLMYRRK